MAVSYKDLKRQIADLEKQASEARKAESVKIIDAIKAQIAEYELTPADLFDGVKVEVKSKSKTRTSAPVNPPKYMDPKTGKTWTGFGKSPTWIASAIKKGNKDDFLIAAVTAAKEAKEKAKAEAKPQAQAKNTASKPTSKAAPAKAAKPVKATAATKPPAKAPAKAKTPAATVPVATDTIVTPVTDEPAEQTGT